MGLLLAVTVVLMTPNTASNETANSPIRVSTPADILSYVPHVLGFQPCESLVFLTMAGKRVGATLRVDLPSAGADALDYARTVRDYLEADTSADGVLMIVYTDHEWTQPDEPPHAGLIHGIDLVLDAAGLPLLDGWLVSSTTWRDYFCEAESCCPWPGHPLASIRESILNAELVYQGSTYAESLEAAMRTADAGHNEEIRHLTSVYSRQWDGEWDRSSLGGDCLILWDALITGESGSGSGEDTPEVIAFLLAGLGCTHVRDSVIVLAAAGLGAAQAAAVESGVLPASPPELELPRACELLKARRPAAQDQQADRRAVSPASGDAGSLFREVFLATLENPDWDRLDAAYAVFLRLAAVSGGEPRSALLSILGWLEWTRGRGSRAHHYLQSALEETPGYTLAELLLTLVGTGSLAPWARRRETAWRSDSHRAA